MKIYFNRMPVGGPWGGGSKILRAIMVAFSQRGYAVTNKLTNDVNVIFCFDPRSSQDSGSLSYKEIENWKKNNPKVVVVQRVGDVGTHGKPELTELVLNSVVKSDVVIYPSNWAMQFVLDKLFEKGIRVNKQFHIIENAPLQIFYEHRNIKNKLPEKLKFVTHHWSTNELKGFDFYKVFASWCKDEGHSFTYIGRSLINRFTINVNEPLIKVGVKGFDEFEGDFTIKDPMNEQQLSIELPKHDVYLTASKFEAGANHVLEAVAAGLPILYSRDGGSIPEYVKSYGVEHNSNIQSIIQSIDVLRSDYKNVSKSIGKYKANIENIAQTYVNTVEGFMYGKS